MRPAATSSSVALPRTARAVGTINGWKLAGADSVSEVWPEVGQTKSGSVALGIDAPYIPSKRTAASVEVPVTPNTTYTFEAYVRVMSKTPKSVSAWFAIGDTPVTFPKLNASWKRVTGQVKTGEGETSTTLAVRISKATRGLSVDAIRMYANNDSSKKNVVPNASFESVKVSNRIANTSLVMTTPTAAMAIAMPAGRISYEISRSGKRLKSGVITRSAPLQRLTLSGIPQGHYTFKVRGSDRKLTTTQIAIIDSPNAWITPDARFGVGLHVEDDIYRDAARYARTLGLSEVRNDIFWERVEKRKGVYDFSDYEAPFTKARLQGLKILGVTGRGNALYGAANASAPRSSTAVRAYGKYNAAVAKRFTLSGLEVFNEFNHPPKNKSGCTSASCYLPLLKAVDSEVSKVKPSLPIVAGATARYPSSWFRELWRKGGLRHANAVSFHPYEITGRPHELGGIVRQARLDMRQAGGTTRPVWVSELGTSSRTGNRTTTQQAAILVQSAASGFATGMRKFLWYDLINDTANPADQEGNFGLYAHPAQSRGAAVAPKTAAFAQALMITQLGGRPYRSTEYLGTDVVTKSFGTSNNLVRVMWTPKGSKTATIRTSQSVVLVGFDGSKRTIKPKSGVVRIPVTSEPVFVRSGSARAGVTK